MSNRGAVVWLQEMAAGSDHRTWEAATGICVMALGAGVTLGLLLPE